jgi:oligosaccharide repeat unit polymerase
MSTATQSIPAFAPAPRPLPAAAFEVLGYLVVVGIATLCFLLGWLTPNGAVILVALLLSCLVVLSWKHFDQGRHPCFLFLCALLLFQGGRLVGYCLGKAANPLQVDLLRSYPFGISRDEAGIVLLALVISAICIYAPCRWNYRSISPPDEHTVRRYLPYLYLVFFSSIPFQLVKNYSYLRYAQEHGGYLVFFTDHAGLAASVPYFVRVVSLLTFPVFTAIFVIEKRKALLWTVTILYFGTAALYLLLGSRMDAFSQVVVFWYVARIKSTRHTRVVVLGLALAGLALVAMAVGATRMQDQSETAADYAMGPVGFVAQQGVSLNVTEVAVKYRQVFRPYVVSYLFHELEDGFISHDISNYARGRRFDFDVPVFLSPRLFGFGYGTAGSYIGESYVIGGLAGVVLISLLIGFGLRALHRFSRNAVTLFAAATILPLVILMPRGNLLTWAAIVIRNLLIILPLIPGWFIFHYFTTPSTTQLHT